MDPKSLARKELERQASDPVGEFDRLAKSAERSRGARELGNELFRDGGHVERQHKMILDRYSASLALAPGDSEELAFAYGNKSALLLHLEKYDECAKDVDRALGIPAAPVTLRIKLLCRKVECLVAVGRVEGRGEALREARRLLGSVDCGEREKETLRKTVGKAEVSVERGVARVPSEDPAASEHLRVRARTESLGVFHSVKLTRDPKLGHHLVASRDFAPGELILVSKPHASVANLADFYSYCGHCADFLWSSVPCDDCCVSLYCSEACRDEARDAYHALECPCLQLIVTGKGMEDYQVHLAMRCVLKAVKEHGSVEAVMEIVDGIDAQPDDDKGFLNDGSFDNQSFRSLFKVRNTRDVSPGFVSHLTERACRAAIVLAKCTSLFGDKPEFQDMQRLAKNEDVVSVATLLLRLSKIVLLEGNRYREGTTACKKGKDQITCANSLSCCERGMYIDTMSRLFSHSCNPNVRSVQIEGGKELWYALQPIREGQPLANCLKSCFFELEKSARASILMPHINRICDCVACANNWPQVLNVYGRRMSFEDLPAIILGAMFALNIRQDFTVRIGEDEQYSQSTVDDLTKLMSAMFEAIKQPTISLCALICLLRFVFDRLHGIKLRIPNECRSALP